ncbi:MAG: integron integrase, partial [Gammaproteobacteria bacterium]|nr:integron integrase [Gammaproteobacteria bacterium]
MHLVKLLDQIRAKSRLKHFSYSTEKSYVAWARRYILYHNKQHPRKMGVVEIEAYLSHLAVERKVSASTQNQALSAILFLYQEILEIPVEGVNAIRAKTPVRLPVVLSLYEVDALLNMMQGMNGLVARLLYGSGLR